MDADGFGCMDYIHKVKGHFNPGLFNHELSNPGFFNNPNPRLLWLPWYPAPPEVGLFAFLWVDFVLYITGAFAKKKTNLGPNL